MIPFVPSLVLSADPSLAHLDRFPSLAACNGQLYSLINLRAQLKAAPATSEREEALRYNTRALAAWELLLEARGGLAEEEGGRDDEVTRQRALERLREMLSAEEWREGRMP